MGSQIFHNPLPYSQTHMHTCTHTWNTHTNTRTMVLGQSLDRKGPVNWERKHLFHWKQAWERQTRSLENMGSGSHHDNFQTRKRESEFKTGFGSELAMVPRANQRLMKIGAGRILPLAIPPSSSSSYVIDGKTEVQRQTIPSSKS